MILLENPKIEIINDDCLNVLKNLPENSIDCIITDPPAGIGFRGEEWDNFGKGLSARDKFIGWLGLVAKECLRVLKYGGHALVWALPKTSHWTATALENAGFEVRDRITYISSKQKLLKDFLDTLTEDQKKLFWLLIDESRIEHCFGSGFPKSLNIGKAIDELLGNERQVIGKKKYFDKYNSLSISENRNTYMKKRKTRNEIGWLDIGFSEWEGWGTALKPAVEDWWLLRKPLEKGLSIAENVLKWGTGGLNIDACRIGTEKILTHFAPKGTFAGGEPRKSDTNYYHNQGRFPSHLIIDDSEEVESLFPLSSVTGHRSSQSIKNCIENRKARKGKSQCDFGGNIEKIREYTDSGSASRFFYCAKASRKEREMPTKKIENNHPTVKPIALMEYLIKLICPPNGIVLDCFMGSGSTGIACINLNRNFIGIEFDKGYFEIAKARIEYVLKNKNLNLFKEDNDD